MILKILQKKTIQQKKILTIINNNKFKMVKLFYFNMNRINLHMIENYLIMIFQKIFYNVQNVRIIDNNKK